MKNYFEAYKISERIYHIKDKLNVFSTLIVGKNMAILFDTSYGIGNLKIFVDDFVNVPYKVINSHGHVDHVGGNYQFEEVFIHQDDVELYIEHSNKEMRRQILNMARSEGIISDLDFEDENINSEVKLKTIEEGKIFDLGDITIEVISMKGHTKGSIGLLIREEKILLAGDGANPFLWLFDKYATDVNTYIDTLTNLKKLDFEYILTSHSEVLLPKNRVDDFLNCAKNIDLKKSMPFHHPFIKMENVYVYNHGNLSIDHPNFASIVFSPEKLI